MEKNSKKNVAPSYDPQPGDVLRPIRQTGHAGRGDVVVVERRPREDGVGLIVEGSNKRERVLSFKTWNEEYRPVPKEKQDEPRMWTTKEFDARVDERVARLLKAVSR